MVAHGLFHFEIHVAYGLFCYRIWYCYYRICESWLRRAQKVCNKERVIHGQSRLTFRAYHSKILQDAIYMWGCRHLYQDRVFTSDAQLGDRTPLPCSPHDPAYPKFDHAVPSFDHQFAHELESSRAFLQNQFQDFFMVVFRRTQRT